MNAASTLALWLAVASLTVPSSVRAACPIESAPHRVPVLELYTSEGCNSCPPADQWLSGLAGRGFDDARVVPLAFHVDYWNQLGWVDRFSHPAYSARQRAVADRYRTGVVYTPQFVLDGKDLRSARTELASKLDAINRQAPFAFVRGAWARDAIALEVTGRVEISERAQIAHSVAWIVVYENRLSTAVRAGENGGRTLAHDYVVRTLIGPLRPNAKGEASIDRRVALEQDWNPGRLGVAVFVENETTGAVLQAAASACAD